MDKEKLKSWGASIALALIGGAIGGALWVGQVQPQVFGGTTNLDSLTLSGTLTAATLDISGATTLSGALTVASITAGGSNTLGNTSVTGTLSVAGAFVAASTTSLNGTVTLSNTTVTGTFATVGNSTLNGTVTLANTSVTGTLSVTGAFVAASTTALNGTVTMSNMTVTGTSLHVGNATFGGTLTATSSAFLATVGGDVGVGTSTNLGADLVVYSRSSSVSSTLMVGSDSSGATNPALLCLWNGSEFTVMYSTSSGDIAFSTSTSCVVNVPVF